MKRLFWVGIWLVCWPGPSYGAGGEKTTLILASIKPLALIAEAIVENTDIQVEVLLPAGASPHDYTLKPSDVRHLRSAELLLWLGPAAEPGLAKIHSPKSLPLVEMLPPSLLIRADHGKDQHGHGHGHDYTLDPHVWLDPGLAREAARLLAQTMSSVTPGEKQQLQANLSRFEYRTKKLEELMRIRLIKLQNKGFWVHHDAYQYLLRPYNLSVLGVILEQPGEAGLSVKHLSRLEESLRGYREICIFTEPQFEQSGLLKLGTQVRVLQGVLDPLGTDADSYEDLMMGLVQGLEKCLSSVAEYRVGS